MTHITQPVQGQPRDLSQEQLLTIPDVVARFQLSKTTVYRLVETRKIPFIKIGGLIRFTQQDINAFLSDSRINAIVL